MAIDPNDLTVRELRDELQNTDDVGEVEAALDAERGGQDRTSAITAIEKRIGALTPDEDEGEEEAEATEGAESGSESVEGEDDAEGADEDAAAEDGQEGDEGTFVDGRRVAREGDPLHRGSDNVRT